MIETMQALLIDWGMKILYVLVILVVGLNIIKILVKLVDKFFDKVAIDKAVEIFIISFFKIVLKILLVISIIGVIGVPMTSFAALIASLGLAIGLSFQGSLSNFAGGMILLILRPFNIGDYIEGAGVSGTVTAITIFYTYLKTVDNKAIFVPNGALSNSNIINYSKNATRRVDFIFGVGYDSKISHVKEVINKVLSNHSDVILSDPAPQVLLANHGESSLDFKVRVWVNSGDYWTLYFAVMEEVKEAFDENNIDIPYPHMVNIVKNS